MNTPSDGANQGYASTGSIEQSVGWLLVGIGVILFFLLTVLGMGKVEQISNEVTHPVEPEVARSTSDIVGVSADPLTE